jgi:hypothetical protein
VVDDHRVGGQPRARRGDDRIHHRVVLQHRCTRDAPRTASAGVAATRDAELRQRLRLVRRAVPCRDAVAALCRRFREGGAEQAGAEKCNDRHGWFPVVGVVRRARAGSATDGLMLRILPAPGIIPRPEWPAGI